MSGDVRLLGSCDAVGVVMVARGHSHTLGRSEIAGTNLCGITVSVVGCGELTWIPYFASKALVTWLSVVAMCAM